MTMPRYILIFLTGMLFLPEISFSSGKIKPAPRLEVKILSDHEVELIWSRQAERLLLERMLPGESVFTSLGEVTGKAIYRDNRLPANTDVQYRLRPVGARYLAQYGNEVTVNIPLKTPPAPKLERVGIDSIILHVKAETGLGAGFIIERRIGGIFTEMRRITGDAVDFHEGRLHTGVYQYYRLKAAGQVNQSPPSPADSIALTFYPPERLDVELLNDHTARLRWTNANDFPCSYEIEKKLPSGSEVVSVGLSESWTDDNIPYASMVYYRIRAVKGDNFSEYGQPALATIKLEPIREAAVDSVHDHYVHLSWPKQLPAAAVQIIERAANGGDFITLARLEGGGTSYVDTLALRGQHLQYRIRSVTSGGITLTSNVVEEEIPVLNEGMVLVGAAETDSGFFMDAGEVTVSQYRRYCSESDRNYPDDPGFETSMDYWRRFSNLPAVNVSWRDAVDFCNWRSRRLGLETAYDDSGRLLSSANGFRLPDESMFLKALVQAGDSTGNFIDAAMWIGGPCCLDSANLAYPTLYHLLGNVWEWNQDAVGPARLILGGAYSTPRALAGDLPRFCYNANWKSPTIGFRCVLPSRNLGVEDISGLGP